MTTSFASFLKNTDSLKKHLQFQADVRHIIEFSNKSVSPLPEDLTDSVKDLSLNSTNERLFNYKANIISLYGALEHYVEELIREYIDRIRQFYKQFSVLDEKIQKDYFEKWKSLHTSIKRGHTKYGTLDEKRMAISLHDSIVNDVNSILPECFIPIGGNYRHKIICDALTALGVKNIGSQLKKYPPFDEYIAKNGLSGIDDDSLFLKIDELVERRNEVAHGAASSILSDEEFKELLQFVEVYAYALDSFITDDLLGREWDYRSKIEVLSPDKVFPSISVISFKTKSIHVRKGGFCLMRRTDSFFPRFIKFRIEDLRIETEDGKGSDTEEVIATGNEVVFSLKIGDDFSEHCMFKFIN